MDEWVDVAYYQITAMAKQDSRYLQLLQRCRETEPDYLAAVRQLSEAEREGLEAYISACEELEHRLAQLAYEFGKTRC